eukprot:scaffold362_cov176-Amphora_coffeaeformis.AAC.16
MDRKGGSFWTAVCPGCPFCRHEMTPENILAVLGRPYQPRTTAIGDNTAAAPGTDDLTLQRSVQWRQVTWRWCDCFLAFRYWISTDGGTIRRISTSRALLGGGFLDTILKVGARHVLSMLARVN